LIRRPRRHPGTLRVLPWTRRHAWLLGPYRLRGQRTRSTNGPLRPRAWI
jgi:hypothetical protein